MERVNFVPRSSLGLDFYRILGHAETCTSRHVNSPISRDLLRTIGTCRSNGVSQSSRAIICWVSKWWCRCGATSTRLERLISNLDTVYFQVRASVNFDTQMMDSIDCYCVTMLRLTFVFNIAARLQTNQPNGPNLPLIDRRVAHKHPDRIMCVCVCVYRICSCIYYYLYYTQTELCLWYDSQSMRSAVCPFYYYTFVSVSYVLYRTCTYVARRARIKL